MDPDLRPANVRERLLDSGARHATQSGGLGKVATGLYRSREAWGAGRGDEEDCARGGGIDGNDSRRELRDDMGFVSISKTRKGIQLDCKNKVLFGPALIFPSPVLDLYSYLRGDLTAEKTRIPMSVRNGLEL